MRSDRERLQDVLAALNRCVRFRSRLDADDGVVAEMALDAILRNLAVAGEAVRALSAETRDLFPSTPWHSIAGLRNIVVHEYFRINAGVIRDIVERDVGPLAEAIRAYIDEADANTSE